MVDMLQLPHLCIALTCEEEGDVVAQLGVEHSSLFLRLHGFVKLLFGGIDLTLQVTLNCVRRIRFLLLLELRRRIVAVAGEGLERLKRRTGRQRQCLDVLAAV